MVVMVAPLLVQRMLAAPPVLLPQGSVLVLVLLPVLALSWQDTPTSCQNHPNCRS